MLPRPVLIGSDIYRSSTYGRQHPLAIPRVSTTIDLCRALGWLPDSAYVDSPRAGIDELVRFHDRDYIEAVMGAEREQRVDPAASLRFNIGRNGNPVFREIFSRPATACGATLAAADRLLAAPGIVYSPAGGTHHGRPGRASGFCYFNDPVLGILRLLDGGLDRVLYVDLDAHHADGVQDALSHDPRVLLISVHEAGRWPFTGAAEDRGAGSARNLAVPPDFNDDELRCLLDEVILPLGARFAPQALVVQAGADALADDPLSRLALSNGALRRAVRALAPLAPRVLVLGGGGYNPWSVARCWTGIWGTLNGEDMPETLPCAAEAVLRALVWSRSQGRNPPDHWFTTLADPPCVGPVRDEVRALVRLHAPARSVAA
jgi:acetoin utilization protein AcuC